MKKDIVAAAAIHWGTYVDYETCNLCSTQTPEQEIILQDTFSKMKKEVRLIATVLLGLPDEMYTQTGRVVTYKLLKHMQEEYGWTPEKTMRKKKELAELLLK